MTGLFAALLCFATLVLSLLALRMPPITQEITDEERRLAYEMNMYLSPDATHWVYRWPTYILRCAFATGALVCAFWAARFVGELL